MLSGEQQFLVYKHYWVELLFMIAIIALKVIAILCSIS